MRLRVPDLLSFNMYVLNTFSMRGTYPTVPKMVVITNFEFVSTYNPTMLFMYMYITSRGSRLRLRRLSRSWRLGYWLIYKLMIFTGRLIYYFTYGV
jgi:hypothetical protein